MRIDGHPDGRHDRRSLRDVAGALPHGLLAGLTGALLGTLLLPLAYVVTLHVLPAARVVAAPASASVVATGAGNAPRALPAPPAAGPAAQAPPAVKVASARTASRPVVAAVPLTDARPQVPLVHKPRLAPRRPPAATAVPSQRHRAASDAGSDAGSDARPDVDDHEGDDEGDDDAGESHVEDDD